jgi:parvulin-like peptidyl-prolyl isomerase
MKHINRLSSRLGSTITLAFALLAANNALAAAAPADKAPNGAGPHATQPAAHSNIFARVGDTVISYDEYNAAFSAAARGKFYHGKPPEAEIASLQREVGDQLVARVLLMREAKVRGIKPDSAEVQKTIQSYEQKYAGSEQWKKSRAQMLPAFTVRLEQESILTQLEKSVRTVAKPDEKDVRAYYAAHQDKFTEPEQLRVSVILLKVDPSSPTEVWLKTIEDGKSLAKKLQGGADFAAIARERSQDPSSAQGGDLGYLHKGMLPDGTEEVLSKLKVGETSEATQLLEGVAIFRLTDRKLAKLNGFDVVRGRAQDLLQRDRSDQAWNDFVAALKKKTPAQIDQSQFLPLAAKSDAKGDAKAAKK